MTKEIIYDSTKNIMKKITTKNCTPICGADERRSYRQRKSVKRHITILVVLSIIITICMGSMIYVFAKESTNDTAKYSSITVQSGDSLWSIAKDYFPENDPRDVIDEIRSLNDIEGYTIYAGQALTIPDCN